MFIVFLDVAWKARTANFGLNDISGTEARKSICLLENAVFSAFKLYYENLTFGIF